MAIAQKEEFELIKVTYELPKFTLNISLFLATAAAFLVRESIGDGVTIFSKTIGAVYIIGLAMTLFQFLSSYNFAGEIFNHSRKVDSENSEHFIDNFEETIKRKYGFMSWLSRITIVYWLVIIAGSVVVAAFFQ